MVSERSGSLVTNCGHARALTRDRCFTQTGARTPRCELPRRGPVDCSGAEAETSRSGVKGSVSTWRSRFTHIACKLRIPTPSISIRPDVRISRGCVYSKVDGYRRIGCVRSKVDGYRLIGCVRLKVDGYRRIGCVRSKVDGYRVL
eukprot:1185424-Prorocentrum_minimum.AAC.4